MKLIYNAIKTPDGTIIESKKRNKPMEYKDKNGFDYIIDGGLEYQTRNFSIMQDFDEISLFLEDKHETTRDLFKIENSKNEIFFLSELDDHDIIAKIFLNNEHQNIIQLFKNELRYRNIIF